MSSQEPNAVCRLTPELSRADRGGWEPVLLALRQVSTRPRNGVGLNDLLGGPDAGENEALMSLPKTEARPLERANELSAGRVRSSASAAANEPMTIVASEARKRKACNV